MGRWIAGRFKNRLHKELVKRDAQQSLINLADTVAPYVVWFIVALVILYFLGAPVDTLLLGAVIIITVVGFAMRESIGNFSATVNFWLFKPFEPGHVIETGTTVGTVQEIQLFSTVIYARDNKVHILPNSLILSNGLMNYTTKGTLRVDLVFSIGYRDDVHKAKALLAKIVAADDRVLSDPAPLIFLLNLDDSKVDIAVRPYVNSENYWSVQSDIREMVKYRLEENGFTIPFPQQDVHLYPTSPIKMKSKLEER